MDHSLATMGAAESSESLQLTFMERQQCPLSAAHGKSTLKPFARAVGAAPFEGSLFSIHQCSACGLGITNPAPTEESSRNLYTGRTSQDFQPNDEGGVAAIKGWFTKRDAAVFARFSKKPLKILDYACGNGAFTIALQQLFPAAAAMGADYHRAPPSSLIEGHYIEYAQLHAHAGTFDLIIARHVLEHSYDPVDFLGNLRSLLSESGVLALEVPELETPVRHLFGKYWDGYYVPYHPLHFTHASLGVALDSAGLSVLSFGTAEMPKMGRGVFGISSACQCRVFAAGVALHPIQVAIGLATGTSVCLRAWVRRA